MMTAKKCALVVEGGAMRGIFSTGVLDGFLQYGFNPFDFCIGVSAGAGNIAAYLADMPERNYRIYIDYALRPRFISYLRFLKGGHLMDLDWLWDITIRECRLDLNRIYKKEKPFFTVLTDIATGKPIYKKTDKSNLEAVLKASSAIPFLYRGFPVIDGLEVSDGGIADSIPVKKAVEMGADRILVIRSRPASYHKKDSIVLKGLLSVLNNRPHLKTAMLKRGKIYNDSLAYMRHPPDKVFILEVTPPETSETGRLSRSKEQLSVGYREGRKMAGGIIEKWFMK